MKQKNKKRKPVTSLRYQTVLHGDMLLLISLLRLFISKKKLIERVHLSSGDERSGPVHHFFEKSRKKEDPFERVDLVSGGKNKKRYNKFRKILFFCICRFFF